MMIWPMIVLLNVSVRVWEGNGWDVMRTSQVNHCGALGPSRPRSSLVSIG
jgi:hypothetical protein